MATEIPADALAAAGLAMVPFSLNDEEQDHFEWHECEDQPACSVKQGQPCACSGMPWPSPAVRAAIAAAAAVLIELGWSPPTGPHVYLSSACRHADDPDREHLHRRCQTDTLRYDGTHKIAAQCKDCGAPCICPCHKEADDAR